MSISSAISNAVSGLNAVSRGTEVVSSNLANVLTPSYARRELELSSRVFERGGGVTVDGTRRMINVGLLADNRLAEASVGASKTTANFHTTIEKTFGTGAETSSLGAALTEFEAALISATSRPDSEIRLSDVLETANTLAKKITEISDTVQAERTKAEQTIKSDVSRLNAALDQVATLNKQIVAISAQGKDASSLIDARQAVIDNISDIVPVREVPRENGRVALFTSGGAILLDGTEPAKIEFNNVTNITADMSLEGGALFTLTFNGKQLTTAQQAMFSGGTLGANFTIRDESAPSYQKQIDAFARDLYDRLADPSVDGSLDPNDPGLFTDAQNMFDPANETGFASRIAVNSVVDPAAGGELWRIRAGINASGAGSAGESSLLDRLGTSLSASRNPASPNLSPTTRSLQTLSSYLASTAASNRIRSEAAALQDSTHQTSLQTALLADGVDSDNEMESLLALERAYSANAKVFQSANDMLDVILRLT